MRFRGLRTAYEACAALAECLQPVPLTADWDTAPRSSASRREPRRAALASPARPNRLSGRAHPEAG
ncbi:MAG TPA: hypothetical protein VLH10_01875 [Yinghuangia sp.]|uniref:hypothetical protein n=1 Tax=Yinghuangia sp. YIM S10712 TaxID=3436930 RepID=UPI002C98DECA|nr:hypothetical protein [Yinghuangia sp.]